MVALDLPVFEHMSLYTEFDTKSQAVIFNPDFLRLGNTVLCI